MNQILPHSLWIGNAGDGRSPRLLCDLEIEAVFQLATDEPIPVLPREMMLIRVPITDGVGNSPERMEFAVSTLAHLIQNKRKTLVCCSAGASRSPAVAACALSRVTGQSPQECLTLIHKHHPTDVAPGLSYQAVEKPTSCRFFNRREIRGLISLANSRRGRHEFVRFHP